MQIREMWLDHHKSRGYKEIIHDPLVHPAFPSSFNMSAGLVQLDPRIRSKDKVSAQKEVLIQPCVRNFDIGKVGDDSHLSFFEMAGAFQVVEFSRIDTVQIIWEFLTNKLCIKKESLWATIFSKDQVCDRVIEIEQDVLDYVAKITGGRYTLGNTESNLWQQGGGAETTDNKKLCGPQVEFFYDFGINDLCKNENCNPLCKCGRFLEISNTLFIEYYIDYKQEPKLYDLQNKCTESVIGIERCLKVFEQTENIYQTSLFEPMLALLPKNIEINPNIRIILDHIKSLLFILSEQRIEPTTRDRGRIIRTLIRGLLSSMYAEKLNPQELLPQLCQKVVQMYQEPYPHLNNGVKTCLEVTFAHEKEYKKTLDKGAKHIKEFIEEKGEQNLTEADYTFFWEKYGFPKKLMFTL